MTILSLGPAACNLLGKEPSYLMDGGGGLCYPTKHNEKASGWKDRPVMPPRINLRKRASPSAAPEATDFAIPQVTSAFLTSLFYEVNNDSSKRPCDGEDASAPSSPAAKKACMTPTKSYKSFGTNLDSLDRETFSPITTNTAFFDREFDVPNNNNSRKDDHPVNHWISSTSQDLAMNVAGLIFPGLSPTVSDPSCSPATAVTTLNFETDQQPSVTENNSANTAVEEDKETYGWFVVVDDDEDTVDKPIVEPTVVVPKDLAFRAPSPTTPMPVIHDDVKWAQAADTVDDVLADFF